METNTLPPRSELLRALARRDAGYEGVFVVAVRTTGIFCRPGCPARTPKPENVEFLLSPERVRRWFQRTHGMSFHGYSRSRRLGTALGRIQQGDRITRAAFESGFDSLSGFSEAFERIAGGTPSERRGAPIVHLTRIATPFGPMVAGATDDALCLLEFADRRMLPTQLERVSRRLGAVLTPGTSPVLDRAATEISEYFAGTRRMFTVPLLSSGTPFQEQVWDELRWIPFGETTSYAELARRIGRPTAMRAVARANGDNRLAILIPCHRVIGADGSLTGYGGGLWRKQRLLQLETASATEVTPQ